jgi:hypothetical protein
MQLHAPGCTGMLRPQATAEGLPAHGFAGAALLGMPMHPCCLCCPDCRYEVHFEVPLHDSELVISST